MGAIDNMKTSMSSITEKQRNLIIGGVLLAIFLLDYFFIMGPQLKNLQTVSPKVSVLSQDLEKARNDLQREGEYRGQVEELQKQLTDINLKIRTKAEVPLILERISSLANDNDVRIDQMLPRLEAQELLLENEEGAYYEMPIQIEARSGYHDMGRFLDTIENSDVSLVLDRLAFSTRSNDRNLHSARMTFTAIVLDKAKKKE